MSLKFRVNIGDWSDDGHGQCEHYMIEVLDKVSITDIQNAFITECERMGLFENKRFIIARDAEDCTISEEHYEVLKENNINIDDLIEQGNDEYYIMNGEAMTHLVMRICQNGINFEYKIIKDTVLNFNGYWNGTLNTQIGYGLFFF